MQGGIGVVVEWRKPMAIEIKKEAIDLSHDEVTVYAARLASICPWYSYLRIALCARIEGKRKGLWESALLQAQLMLQSTTACLDLFRQLGTAHHSTRP